MTAADNVSTNKAEIGAKKVSGLSRNGRVTKFIKLTTTKMYEAAPSALATGFLFIT